MSDESEGKQCDLDALGRGRSNRSGEGPSCSSFVPNASSCLRTAAAARSHGGAEAREHDPRTASSERRRGGEATGTAAAADADAVHMPTLRSTLRPAADGERKEQRDVCLGEPTRAGVRISQPFFSIFSRR